MRSLRWSPSKKRVRHSTQCGTFYELSLVGAPSRVWTAARYITLPRFCKRQLVPLTGHTSLSDAAPCDLTSGRWTPPRQTAQPDCKSATLTSGSSDVM